MSLSPVDLFTFIFDDGLEGAKAVQLSETDFLRDAQLAIIAGSDTTSTTLVAVLYLLAKNPDQQRLLQHELDSLAEQSSGEKITFRMLLEAPFLNSCIKETLRLYPVVPGGVQRITPPSGTNIAGRYIPGDTIVSTPTYSLHRGIYFSSLTFGIFFLLITNPQTLATFPTHHPSYHPAGPHRLSSSPAKAPSTRS